MLRLPSRTTKLAVKYPSLVARPSASGFKTQQTVKFPSLVARPSVVKTTPGATGELVRSSLGDFCDTPLCEQSGSIDFVCITEGYRLMDWFLLFYRALVEEYFVPACKAGDL